MCGPRVREEVRDVQHDIQDGAVQSGRHQPQPERPGQHLHRVRERVRDQEGLRDVVAHHPLP